jgi:uncharacterized 2Fe-2S/4Fe-4S cluster protein (DUF4445 family)
MNIQNNITFQPLGRRTTLASGLSLLDAAHICGVDITSICGGMGICDSCRVRLISGTLSPMSIEEQANFTPDEIADGYRLACQSIPLSDVVIEIPPSSLTTPQRLQVEGKEEHYEIDPFFTTLNIQLIPPELDDLFSDSTRLSDKIASIRGGDSTIIEYPLLTHLSDILRSSNWHISVAMRNSSVVAAFPASDSSNSSLALFGLAVDIGTTKLAAYLVDLTTGNTVAKIGAMNPQIAFGEDVIARIAYTNTHASVSDSSNHFITGRKWLQVKVVDAINAMIDQMITECAQSGLSIAPDQILDAVIVGNTAMHHLFAGLPVSQLGVSPYVASVSESLEILARDIGLNINPGAFIYLPPNIAGYVGADHISMLIASVFSKQSHESMEPISQNIIALDIGTNTEISLIYPQGHLCCSCASGPAFEGAHILFGMRAASGAIERVQISDGEIHLKVINDSPPVGICGSGILDAISELRLANIVDRRGAILPGHPSVKSKEGQNIFILTPAENTEHGKDIVISRKDITEIQLAKGAIRTGIDILLAEAGLKAEAIDAFIVAGAFGTYIDIQSAINIGMFPKIPVDRYSQIGNAAGTGAREMLLSRSKRDLAVRVAHKIKYVELSDHKDFSTLFSQSIYL